MPPPSGYQPVPTDPEAAEATRDAPQEGSSAQPDPLFSRVTKTIKRFLVPILLVLGTFGIILLAVTYVRSGPAGNSGDGSPGNAPDAGPIPAFVDPQSNWTWNRLRLPDHVRPVHYDLDFVTEIEEGFTFGGNVTIDVEITERRNYVVFHAHLLDMPRIELACSECAEDPKTIIPRKVNEDTLNRQWSAIFSDYIQPGLYRLQIAYHGKLYQQLRGYYLSEYQDDDGKTHYLATSQFEATDARRAFPSFDEPSLKATFTIHMTIPAKYAALSNMEPKGISMDSENAIKRYDFETTKQMSTYLIAFVVHEFDHVEAYSRRSNKRVRVYTRAGKTYQGEFALQCAIDIIDHYEYLFDIEYQLDKEDLIAIPDFGPGAMENWGLITYRDTDLLVDPDSSSPANRQRVASVVAHELAHQWFGNLVTMDWWDSLWLNEGFATYTEYLGVNATHPEYHMLDQFFLDDTLRGFSLDAANYTHPIHPVVKELSQIDEIFDAVSYSKGGSALRMLQSYLDYEMDESKWRLSPFYDGLHNYLDKNKFGNAKTTDLWDALNVEGKSVPEFMTTWTEQAGYPVIEIHPENEGSDSLDSTRDVSLHAWKITQERFFDNPVLKGSSDQSWIVPFTYTIYSNKTGSPQVQVETRLLRLEGGSSVIDTLPGAEPKVIEHTLDLTPKRAGDDYNPIVPFIKANFDQRGFYRVQLPLNMIEIASEWLLTDTEFLSPLDRSGLLEDSLAMLMAGRYNGAAVPLALSKFLVKEESYQVWSVAIGHFAQFQHLLSLTQGYGYFQEYVWRLMDRMLEVTGWTEKSAKSGDAHLRSIMRGTLYNWGVRIGHPRVIEEALGHADALISGKKPDVETSTLTAIFTACVSHGGEARYNWVLDQYFSSSFAEDIARLLYALAAPQEPHLIARSLELALSGHVRQQDALRFVANIARLSPFGAQQTWNFLRDNWGRVLDNFGEASSFGNINAVLTTVTGLFTSPSMIEDVARVRATAPEADFSHQVPGGAGGLALSERLNLVGVPGKRRIVPSDHEYEMPDSVKNRGRPKRVLNPHKSGPVHDSAPQFKLPPRGGEAIDRGLEDSRVKVRWLQKYGAEVQQWFENEVVGKSPGN